MTIGGAILQNQLHHKLPPAFVAQFPSESDLAYSSIPIISRLEEPLRSQVRDAFGDSFAVIWRVMAGIVGVGLLSSLCMQAMPLHTQVDDRWGLADERSTVMVSDTVKDVHPSVVRVVDIIVIGGDERKGETSA